MRERMLVVVVWLVLGSPLLAFLMYEIAVHPHHHPAAGPHGGPLAEWGKHEYVLEVVADPDGPAIAVYVLDRWAKKPKPIDAAPLALTLQTIPPMTLALTPVPGEHDRPGTASRFMANLAALPPEGDLAGSVSGRVGAKRYTADFQRE